MSSLALKKFNYKFSNGPLLLKQLKKEDFKEGNCRLAIQYYLFKIHNRYFKPDLILNPKAYQEVGNFIVKEGSFDKNSLGLLEKGDIIYADKIKSKKGSLTRKNWIIGLHSAIYAGNSKIWHATAIEGKSVLWNFSKFVKYYTPIAAKRVL